MTKTSEALGKSVNREQSVVKSSKILQFEFVRRQQLAIKRDGRGRKTPQKVSGSVDHSLKVSESKGKAEEKQETNKIRDPNHLKDGRRRKPDKPNKHSSLILSFDGIKKKEFPNRLKLVHRGMTFNRILRKETMKASVDSLISFPVDGGPKLDGNTIALKLGTKKSSEGAQRERGALKSVGLVACLSYTAKRKV